ncbi:MAG TPA: hypothetical protein VFF95_16625 [Candidatus Binatus sp.]|nr:hypothetical protein [Candidatus Binatus sp.]
MATQVSISMSSIPTQQFLISARENASSQQNYRCAGSQPKWVANLLSGGAGMSLATLIFQAGRHFSDRLNTSVMAGSSSKRQKAAALAWAITSMINPYVENGRLWVENPNDQDIKRLCSEILGVGAGLALLSACHVIDGRTIRKRSSRFDFEANSPNGGARVSIEAKGTFNGVSSARHRNSFNAKLSSPGVITTATPRGYGRAIGVIFSLWSKEAQRRPDVELLDPEHEAEDTFEEAVREVIRFYARALDEVIGKERGAQLLYGIADSGDLFNGVQPLPIELDDTKRFPIEFHRSTIRLNLRETIRTFLGGFWESRVVPPVQKEIADQNYEFAYTGIDRFVYDAIRKRAFSELLSFHGAEDQLFKVEQEGFRGHFLLDRYGVLRAWMNRVPDEIEFELAASKA